MSEFGTHETQELSSKSQTHEESNEINHKQDHKIHSHRGGHRKIHVITVKKVKDLKHGGRKISIQLL